MNPEMGQQVEPFQFDQLGDAGSIRLIRLDGRGGPSTGTYEMQTFGIAWAPPYHALSYCWGIHKKSDIIPCNNSKLQITAQLKLCLEELWAVSSLRTWLWVDQICINQDDIDEQSRQVRLMPQIYSHAIRTIVWLGPRPLSHSHLEDQTEDSTKIHDIDCQNDDLGFALAEQIYTIGQQYSELNYRSKQAAKFSRTFGSWNGKLPKSRGLARADDLIRFGLPAVSDHRWQCLYGLLEPPWFSRIWVIQEVFKSQEEPLILYNKTTTSFLYLAWAGAFVSQNLGVLTRSHLVHDLAKMKTTVRHARLLLQLAVAKTRWNFDSLLWKTADYGASDQRDKFYALLSLTGTQSEELGTTLSRTRFNLPVPNYRLSLVQVAQAFTRHIIEAYRDLLILALINRGAAFLDSLLPCPENGPTWAYIPSNNPCSLRFGEGHVLTGYPYSITRKGLTAASSKRVRIREDDDPNVLSLLGRRVDTIHTSDHTIETHLEPQQWLADGAPLPRLVQWCEWGYKALCEIWRQDISVPYFLSCIFVTIATQQDLQGGDVRPSIADFRSWLYANEFGNSRYGSYLTAFTKMEDSAWETDETSSSAYMQKWIDMYETGECRYRQFGITSKGLLVLGPTLMDEGDVVCVLNGGQLPYVLRPHGEQFLFLGECYVHELSNGLDWDKHVTALEEWFSLV
ncbi:hypothetical protein NM208_g11837 [Fusarium decemcellulare]|uniref:Uncharacterized protein n=1 Tax=Fusarium decemcellulare TaxID=57161 RepID=A0ACC1RTL8_9HYPO|nr:hypothetical protein NM208_g11837 [Fusarium decemcellulare]